MPNQGGTGSSAGLATGGAGTVIATALSPVPVIGLLLSVLLLSPLPRPPRRAGGGKLWTIVVTARFEHGLRILAWPDDAQPSGVRHWVGDRATGGV